MMLSTTCPECGTTFRVQSGQLRQRNGLVRCGVCQNVFSALDALQPADEAKPRRSGPRDPDAPPSVAQSPAAQSFAAPHAALPQMPETAGLLRMPDATSGPPRSAAASAARSRQATAPDRARRGPAAPGTDTPHTPPRARRQRAARTADSLDRPGARSRRAAGTVLLAALSVAAVLQAALAARDTLAARVPALRPALAALAGAVGLSVQLPRRLSQLTIEGVDLHAGAEPSQLVLTAVLRNTGAMPTQWPAMELTLSDEANRVVVRRALLPTDYLRGTPRQPDDGIAARSELPVRLVLQAPAARSSRYAVSLFYP